jgi:hypothetical protein
LLAGSLDVVISGMFAFDVNSIFLKSLGPSARSALMSVVAQFNARVLLAFIIDSLLKVMVKCSKDFVN